MALTTRCQTTTASALLSTGAAMLAMAKATPGCRDAVASASTVRLSSWGLPSQWPTARPNSENRAAPASCRCRSSGKAGETRSPAAAGAPRFAAPRPASKAARSAKVGASRWAPIPATSGINTLKAIVPANDVQAMPRSRSVNTSTNYTESGTSTIAKSAAQNRRPMALRSFLHQHRYAGFRGGGRDVAGNPQWHELSTSSVGRPEVGSIIGRTQWRKRQRLRGSLTYPGTG